MDNPKPPSFLVCWIDSIRVSAKRRGVLGILPYKLLACYGIPPAVTYVFCFRLLDHTTQPTAITVISAFIGVVGILTAFSISVFSQIMNICNTYPFTDYLKQESLYDLFVASPQMVMAFQIFSIFSGAISITTFIFEIHALEDYVFSVFVGSVLYAILSTWSLVELTRIISWYYSEYQRLYHKSSTEH